MKTERVVARQLAATAFCLLLAGCVPELKEPAREPVPTIPESFEGDSNKENAALLNYQSFFADEALTGLIKIGLENNQELNIAALEVDLARFEVLDLEGEYLPKLGLEAETSLEKVGDETSQGRADEATRTPKDLDDYRIGLAASWEIDLWRKLRNVRDAAARRALASNEMRRLLVTNLVAEIASSYFELEALDNRLSVLDNNIEIQQQALAIVKLQKEAGRVTELAVKRFEAEVAKNKSRRFSLLQEIIETENRLNLLLGRKRQAIERNPAALMNTPINTIAMGVPTQLLENRPDVRRAELELEASKLDVESTRANFYPSLELKASIALSSFDAPTFYETPASLAYMILAGVSQPIWNRQAITARYFSANAKQMQAVLDYEQTILRAYTEVLNQLAKVVNLESSFNLRSQQVQWLNESVEISNRLFQSARADYMEVLLTRREALEAQMELVETRLSQKMATVSVYRALGGGWK